MTDREHLEQLVKIARSESSVGGFWSRFEPAIEAAEQALKSTEPQKHWALVEYDKWYAANVGAFKQSAFLAGARAGMLKAAEMARGRGYGGDPHGVVCRCAHCEQAGVITQAASEIPEHE